jgi:hypothetical protein
MWRFHAHFLTLGLGAGLILAAALSLPGCLGNGDGNPSRESISAKRGKESAREDFKTAKTKSKAGAKLGGKSGGR